ARSSRRTERDWVRGFATGALFTAAACGAAVIVVLRANIYRRNVKEGRLVQIDGRPLGRVQIPERQYARSFTFADGSSMRVQPGTAVQATRNDRKRFSLTMRNGRIDLHVQPLTGRQWNVRCGRARVEVVGTEFGVACNLDKMCVVVRKGVVAVREGAG